MAAAIVEASQLKAFAEDMRARQLIGEAVSPDDLVRMQRLADATERRLGLDQRREPAGPTLQEYFAARAAETGQDAGEASADSGVAT
jgi:hypothetical protein